jgi:tetratricopeptide (TPR) repeat protein
MRMTAEKFRAHFSLLLYEHNYAEAERYVAQRADLADREFFVPDSFFAGVAARAQNENDRATAAFLGCRNDLEKQIREQPNMGIWISSLGLVDAALNRRELAIDEATRARELTDELSRSMIMLDLPNVYCWLGDRDRALNELEKLLNEGAIGISYGDLNFNPAWGPLRGNPRFEKILARAAEPIPLK